MPLTDLQIRKSVLKDKAYKLADGGGLYLDIRPNGSRYWRLKYRIDGKEKLLALGVYPEVSLAEARERRTEARKKIASGIDPCAERQTAKQVVKIDTASTFEVVAQSWWSEHQPTWSPAYAQRIRSRLEADILPFIGNLDIRELTPAHLRDMTEHIRARGVTETVRRALQDVGQILIHADMPDLTVSQRKKLPSYKVKHMSAITDPREAANLLRAIDAYSGGHTVRNALKLAPLVFVRPGELRSAKWVDIDFGTAEWRYHVSKTDVDHIVPLSCQALEVLREQHRSTGHDVYVFPSPRGVRPMSENALRAALIAMGFGEDQTAHGFRAMARTIIDEELGYPPHVIEQQLAHTVKDPLGRAYNRTAHLAQRKEMMQAWADYLDQLKAGADALPLIGSVR